MSIYILIYSEQHSADFEYLDANRIALAGQASDDGTPAGVLKVFMIANEKSEEILFSAVGHTSPECIQNEVGHPGSTTTSEIFVHSHDSGRRMTVFKRDLLTEEIHVCPKFFYLTHSLDEEADTDLLSSPRLIPMKDYAARSSFPTTLGRSNIQFRMEVLLFPGTGSSLVGTRIYISWTSIKRD